MTDRGGLMAMGEDEMERLLDEFGRKLCTAFDWSLLSLKNRLEGTEHRSDLSFQNYISSLPEFDRYLAIAQKALETFTHDLMFLFESDPTFKITATAKHGGEVRLTEDATEGLHAAQMNWRETYSQFGLLEDKIREFEERPSAN
jgi:hypothetical protein